MVKKEPNYKLHVLYATVTAFVLVFVIHVGKKNLSLIDTSRSEDTLRNTFTGDSVEKAFVAWGFIALVLFSGAAFDSTASLAAAFAWLLLVAVILINGDYLVRAMGFTPNQMNEFLGNGYFLSPSGSRGQTNSQGK